jgi:hypothetical protein
MLLLDNFLLFIKNIRPIFISIVVLLFTFIFSDLSFGNGVLNDYFHHGEFFNVLPSILLKNDNGPYLSVHGALDYLPAWLAFILVGQQYYVHTTHLFYILLKLFSCILFLLVLNGFFKDRLSLICCAFIAPFIVNYRDFSLILLVLIYFETKNRSLGSFNHYIGQILVGILSIFNLFYSTNRGIAGFAAIGAAILIDTYYDKRNFVAIISFILGLAFINKVISVFSIDYLINQVPFLLSNTKRWGYEHNNLTIALSIYIGLLLSISIMLVSLKVFEKKSFREDLANVILLASLSLFYFQISTYRADIYHIVMGLIIVLTNLFYFFKLNYKEPTSINSFSFYLILIISLISVSIFSIRPLVILLPLFLFKNIIIVGFESLNSSLTKFTYIFLIFMFSILQFRIVDRFNNGSYTWLYESAVFKENQSVLSDEIKWVNNIILSKNTSCLLDMTNSGLINSVTMLPNCTKYSYIAFANPTNENELIADLETKNPIAVVMNSDGNYFEINQVSIDKIFPALHLFILKNYPNEICHGSFCVRSK